MKAASATSRNSRARTNAGAMREIIIIITNSVLMIQQSPQSPSTTVHPRLLVAGEPRNPAASWRRTAIRSLRGSDAPVPQHRPVREGSGGRTIEGGLPSPAKSPAITHLFGAPAAINRRSQRSRHPCRNVPLVRSQMDMRAIPEKEPDPPAARENFPIHCENSLETRIPRQSKKNCTSEAQIHCKGITA